MRPIDRKFFVSSLVFGGVCILYAVVLNYLRLDIAALAIDTFFVPPRVTGISIDLAQNFYWFSCSILFGVLFSQWIISQSSEQNLAQRISLTKKNAPASTKYPK